MHCRRIDIERTRAYLLYLRLLLLLAVAIEHLCQRSEDLGSLEEGLSRERLTDSGFKAQ